MKKDDFSITVTLGKSPEEVFNSIRNVRGWWSTEIEGETANLNDEFAYHFEDLHYCQIKLTEVIENKRIGWLVKYNYFKHTKDRSEWTGTTISFDISKEDGKTILHFVHHGLTPEFECYETCVKGWTQYVGRSLVKLIETGVGEPNATGTPRTVDEIALLQSK